MADQSAEDHQHRRDAEAERQRYDIRAREASETRPATWLYGSERLSAALSAPYLAYETALRRHLKKDDEVLELGAGQGEHSRTVLEQGVRLTALDISQASLTSFAGLVPDELKAQLSIQLADIEAPDLQGRQFDHVVSAGALSYGRQAKIVEMLSNHVRPGGCFIAVDSWNHNPIYRWNRWRHVQKGARSRSTIQNMPDQNLINALRQHFDVKVQYFGALSFLIPVLRRFLSPAGQARFLTWTDSILPLRLLAFKIVIIAVKKYG